MCQDVGIAYPEERKFDTLTLTQKTFFSFFRTPVHIFMLYPVEMMDDVNETLFLVADPYLPYITSSGNRRRLSCILALRWGI